MKARGSEGNEIEIKDDDVQAFRSRLRGPLLLAGESGYDESRSLWNAMIDRRPALIARCLGAADVIQGVKFARERGLLLGIKGGGHNIAGLAVGEGGLLLDLSLMRGVWVRPEDRKAYAQAGCLLGDVDHETQIHGLAAVMGFISNTGIAGLTLGGGFGYLTRRQGWTSDNVIAMDVVTAEGRMVRASERQNPDLFWGLRGGGGNFGVVTGFEYQLHPVGPEVVAGAVAWRAEEARGVLELFRRLAEQGPPEMTPVLTLRPAPPAPWIAKEAHGHLVVVMVICHTGSIEAAERDILPIKSFGKPVGDVLTRRSYVSQQSLLDATQPKGRRYYWKSEYLAGLEDALFDKIEHHASRITSPHSGIILFPVAGALHRFPADHSPAGNRDAHTVLNIAAAWEKPEDDRANLEWARSTWIDMKSFSTGGTYVNFLTEEETGDRIQAAYGGNLDRLTEVKGRWDPGNLFRMNKNIAPHPTPA